MMLKLLREKTKVILWIVVVAFVISIFAVWGMNLRTPTKRRMDSDVIGAVNGELINRREYSSAFDALLGQLKMQRGEEYEPSTTEIQMLADQAWETAIRNRLIAKEIRKLQISVSDDELVAFLRRNPHPSLRKVFVDEEGQFDYQAYLRALADPQADWTELEVWGRSIIPEIKLQTYLASQIHIPTREIMERFSRDLIQVKAKYVEIPFPEEDPPYTPSETEIAAEYEKSKEDFKQFESRRIRLIEVEKKAAPADELEALERLEEIRDEILAGMEFEEAARSYSDDHITAQNGGDLGFFKKGDMVKEFDEAVFALDVGGISEPVRTQYGYHLITVVEKKTEEDEEKVRARHILMKVELGYETIDSLGALIRNVAEAIKENGFDKAAEDFGLTVKEPPPFARTAFIQDLGYIPNVANFSFNYGEGSISSAIESETGIYFVKVVEEIPARTKSLDEVSSQLAETLRRTRAAASARAITESIRSEALTSGDLDRAAHAAGLEVRETALFKADEIVPGIGANTAFSTACHLLRQGELSAPVKGQDAYYLIMVTERTEPDLKEFADKREEIVGQLRNDLASRFMAKWYNEIRAKADVDDNRQKTLF